MGILIFFMFFYFIICMFILIKKDGYGIYWNDKIFLLMNVLNFDCFLVFMFNDFDFCEWLEFY